MRHELRLRNYRATKVIADPGLENLVPSGFPCAITYNSMESNI